LPYSPLNTGEWAANAAASYKALTANQAATAVYRLVIAHQSNESIRYALEVVPHAALQLYEVEFRLRPPSTGVVK